LGGADGKIHIDFYRDTTGGTNPSFTDTMAAGAQITDRTGFSTFTGITDGALEMAWEFVPSPLTLADPLALPTTLFQNISSATVPISGDGNFFAECIAGPLCGTFNSNSQTTGVGSPADFNGGYDLTPTATNQVPIIAGALSNGWLLNIEDPVLATATNARDAER
jgi:hypothetical protein